MTEANAVMSRTHEEVLVNLLLGFMQLKLLSYCIKNWHF